MSIATKFMKATRWNSLNYSHGNIHERRMLEAECLKVWTWGSWKSRHQNVSPSCLQLATKHKGKGEDSAQSGAAVTQEAQQCWESQVQGTHSSLWSRCVTTCPVRILHWTELWHLQVSDCTLQAGGRACHVSIWWELFQMPVCLLCLSFSQGISYWYSSPKHLEMKIILEISYC